MSIAIIASVLGGVAVLVICIVAGVCRRRSLKKRAKGHRTVKNDVVSSRQSAASDDSNGVSDSESALSNTRMTGDRRCEEECAADVEQSEVYSNPEAPSEYDRIGEVAQRICDFAARSTGEGRFSPPQGIRSPGTDTLSLALSASRHTLPQCGTSPPPSPPANPLYPETDEALLLRYTEISEHPEFAAIVDATGVIPSLYKALENEGIPDDKLEASVETYFEQMLTVPGFHKKVLDAAADMGYYQLGESVSSFGTRQPSSQVGLMGSTEEEVITNPDEVHITITNHSDDRE